MGHPTEIVYELIKENYYQYSVVKMCSNIAQIEKNPNYTVSDLSGKPYKLKIFMNKLIKTKENNEMIVMK